MFDCRNPGAQFICKFHVFERVRHNWIPIIRCLIIFAKILITSFAKTTARTSNFNAEKDRLVEEELRSQADERAPKPGTAAALRMEKTERNLNGWFDPAEELENEFSDALEEKMQVGGIILDEVRQRMNYRHKFDLVGINSDAIVVGKVKCKLLPEDVRYFAENHLPYFAEEFSTTAERRKIYGMVCGGTIVDDAATEAVKLGLFVLRLKNKQLLVENVDTACPVN